jgi:hypothetical protein
MRDLTADLRFALRRWTRRPTFAMTAILTLALGIGAATAIFSVVNGGAIVSQDRGAVVSRLTTMTALLARSVAEERYRDCGSSGFDRHWAQRHEIFDDSCSARALASWALAVLAVAAAVGTLATMHRAGRTDPAVALRQG